MATPQQKLPKGPSNSSGFGTPGTQQTAQKNVKTGGFDPNMPKAPQAARQARSSYQQSLGAQAGVPGAPASGYSLFSGMPTQQALGLNRSLGLSNLGPMGGGTPPPQAPGLPPGLGQQPLPPSGGQGATAPRGTASVLQGPARADLGIPGRGIDPRIQEEFGRGVSRAGAPDPRVDLGLSGRGIDVPEPQWKSASMPWLTGREVLAEQSGVPHKEVFPENALQGTPAEQYAEARQGTPAEGAPLSGEEAWGLFAEGTMTKEQVMQALGMTGEEEFTAWEAANNPWAGYRGNVKDPSEYGADEYNPYTGEDGPAVSDGAGGWVSAPRGDASDLEAQAAFGAQFYEDPDKMMGLATNNVLRKDKPGYEDEKVQEVKNNLAKQAEISYQQNLDQLMRQFAVMGTAGSGAFMMANNNLAVQIYGKLLDEYAQIDLKNLDQIEIDLQQEVQNLLAISQMGYANEEDFYETLKKIDENLFMTFTGFLEAMDLTDDQNGQWFQALAEFYEDNWNKVVSGEMTEEEFTQAGMGLLSGKIGEFNLTDEQAAGAWDAMDEHYASQADPSSPMPDDAEPPTFDGTHVGHFKENDGHIWKWNEDTQRWEWQGKQK